MKIRRLLVSSFVAITAVLGTSYAAFEYWVTLKANNLPKAVTEGKLTEVTAVDVEQIDGLADLLAQSPLPWHQQQAHRFNDLLEVVDAAHQALSSQRVNQLRVGQLLTLQQEMEDYVQRYPDQPYSSELQQELPAVRSLVTFFPIIKASAGERSVDSALRASRRGATLAALVIRKVPAEVMVADSTPAVPEVAWTKAENDVLYDYSQALQAAERERLDNTARLKIGRQVCNWLEAGQGYWSVRSLFDLRYKNQVAGDYYHNRDAYIRFGTERLCPQHMASLTPPPANTDVQIAKTPAINPTAKAANNWNAATTPYWTTEVPAPPYGQGVPAPFVAVPPGQGVVMPAPGFPGSLR
ncbi:MAG: hypothetical protein IGS54_17300 [Elainella sp. C42_A2020_010]|nr:hypothetical protein [Elainella sp. C42_A2020_010]